MSLEPTSIHQAAAVQRPELTGYPPLVSSWHPIVLRPAPLEVEQTQHGQAVSDQAGDGRWLPDRPPNATPVPPADSVEDSIPADGAVTDERGEPGQQLDVRG